MPASPPLLAGALDATSSGASTSTASTASLSETATLVTSTISPETASVGSTQPTPTLSTTFESSLASTPTSSIWMPDGTWTALGGSSGVMSSPAGPYYELPLSATIRITEFASFPITYTLFPDGSLLTPLYATAQRDANIFIFTTAIILVVFVRNVVVAARYVRRIKAKDMTLFYLLLFSQVWGPVACIAVLSSLVSKAVDCTAANVVATLCAVVSFTVLTSGILGMKAYRCLNRSASVLAAICVTQLTALGFALFELHNLKSTRSLTDICEFSTTPHLFPIAFAVSSIETLIFVCMCFTYAVWNATRHSAGLTRISLNSSQPEAADAGDEAEAGLRGWWDYRPRAAVETEEQAQSLLNRVRTSMAVIRNPPQPPTLLRPDPLPRQGRSHLRGMASQLLLNVAIRNELFYAGLILVVHSIAMAMLLISTEYNLSFGPPPWFPISWTITSVLVMQSFAGVAERHEREALIREPSVWDAHGVPVAGFPPRARDYRQTPWGPVISTTTHAPSVRTARAAPSVYSARSPSTPRAPTGEKDAQSEKERTAPALPSATLNPFADYTELVSVGRRGSAGLSRAPSRRPSDR